VTPASPSQETYEAQWWRALAVFRIVSVLYAAALYVRVQDEYRHPNAGWVVLALMGAWTGFTVLAYSNPTHRRWPLLTADLAIAAAAIVATRPVQEPEMVLRGAQTLPVTWVVAPVVAWALVYGWFAAVPTSAAIGVANVVERSTVTAPLLHNTALVLLAGTLVGYVASLARRAEGRLAEAVRREAATAERDRLARAVHDGVLQVLALVARRGRDLGGDAAVIGRLAAEQEVALRALVAGVDLSSPGATSAGDAETDLRQLFASVAASGVTIATPATPVLLPTRHAHELHAAVEASLDNVDRHAGPDAQAYVLVEDNGQEVVVTVRDDGRGFPPGRLEQARAEGRMGISHSVVGRLAELGGSASYEGHVDDGVEVVLRLPRISNPVASHG
jgi:signal transduction histidine kinase